ncbi:MAG: acylphosphatase [Promethearchaeota archaeon]
MRLHAIISGRVQGVFFRVNTRNKANELGLSGWVKNRWDGKVEVICEGSKEMLEIMLKWLKKGPKYAFVEKVDYRIEEKDKEFGNFEILY